MSAHVFVSYATLDRQLVDRLRDELAKHDLNVWIDHQNLKPGTFNWEFAVRDAIEKSSVVLLVATPHARRSVYVQDEIAIAQMYARELLPVWLDGDHWIDCVPMGLGRAQYLDLRRERYVSTFSELVTTLHNLVQTTARSDAAHAELPVSVAPSPFAPRNPYKGLAAFSESDAGDFFGRDDLIDTLVTTIMGQQSERFLAVIGASGSGKSSLIMAGVVPKLKQRSELDHQSWLYLPTITPGKHPLASLASILTEVSGTDATGALADPSTRGLHRIVEQLAGTTYQRVVLVVDQFEELFTQTEREDERRQFIDNLTTAATEPNGWLTVILTMRADFYDRPMSYAELGRLIRTSNQSLLPMTISELYSAIEKPAALPTVQLEFESGLVASIVFDLRDETSALAGALPLLQFALERLYDMRHERKLTWAAYERIGGVRGAIGNHAEAMFNGLDAATQNALPRVFWALVSVDERGEATRRRAPLSDFKDEAAALVNALINARLLISDRDKVSGAPYVEVAHESLLRNWKRLVEWIRETADDLRLLRKTEIAAAEWDLNGRPDYLLWSHELLEPVYKMRDRLGIELCGALAEFARPEAERLLKEFDNAPDYRRMMIIDRCKHIGVAAAGVLVNALQDRDASVRRSAIQVLQEFNEADTLTLLKTEIVDNHPRLQKRFATFLDSRPGDLPSTGFLEKLLDLDIPPVQSLALRKLVQIGTHEALTALFAKFDQLTAGQRTELTTELKTSLADDAKRSLLIDLSESTPISEAQTYLKAQLDATAPGRDELRDVLGSIESNPMAWLESLARRQVGDTPKNPVNKTESPPKPQPPAAKPDGYNTAHHVAQLKQELGIDSGFNTYAATLNAIWSLVLITHRDGDENRRMAAQQMLKNIY
ncbi:MAG: toll/interleukin-1 receptor domain-containing protein, partial [Anaerolinea sp.]|nr:toll/interleukin-1 receptor domain-containing protein [Anaerolinea sp.]